MAIPETTDIVEIPAVRHPNGEIVYYPAEVAKLDERGLKYLQGISGGDLVWIKYRAVFAPIEVPLCSYRGCMRPVGSIGEHCDLH